MPWVVFVIAILLYGIIGRLQFIGAQGGYDKQGEIKVDYRNVFMLRSFGSFFAFVAYIAVAIWGFINASWYFAIGVLFAGMLFGGLLITTKNFDALERSKPSLEFIMIVLGIFLWLITLVPHPAGG